MYNHFHHRKLSTYFFYLGKPSKKKLRKCGRCPKRGGGGYWGHIQLPLGPFPWRGPSVFFQTFWNRVSKLLGGGGGSEPFLTVQTFSVQTQGKYLLLGAMSGAQAGVELTWDQGDASPPASKDAESPSPPVLLRSSHTIFFLTNI